MSRAAFRCLAAGFVVALAAASPVRAQSRLTGADLVGRVTDESKAVLPGATVTVVNRDTNLTRTATSDAQGEYKVPALPPGTYKVTVGVQGFANQARDGVTLQLGQTMELEFTLKLAGTQEEVTIVGEAPVVDVTDTSVSTVVGQQQIENLPINGRNFISFSIITPGVTTDRTPQQGASLTSGLSFTGQRARSNNIMVDGLDNNDIVVGAVRATFSQEAIREFQVVTDSYSAEFGKATGGVVNIVTKSGTNEFHGNAFYYFRDESLNAKDHFEEEDVFGNPVDREKAPFSANQYGATLGGPIRKDKTFFFLSFERADVSASNFVNIAPATAALLTQKGFPVETGAVPYDFKIWELLGKIDHQWSPNSTLVFRANYSDTHNENIEPFGGIVAKSRGAVQLRKDWSLSLSQSNVIGTRWVNEARVQVAKQDQDINSLDPRCDGECDTENEGGPTLEVTGVASVGRQRFTPQPRRNTRFQLMDTVSLHSGRHSAKAGIDFNWVDTPEGATSLPLHFGGRYIFASLPAVPALGIPAPISALQALAADLPAAYVQGYGDSFGGYGYKDLSIFVQDEWRVSRKLTLKAGLRYQKQFWDELGYDVSDVRGARYTYNFPDDGNNIAPRVSFAFDPGGNGRTSIHGAYGIYFDNNIAALFGVTEGINGGTDGVRTLVLRFPASIGPYRTPARRIPEPATPYPSLEIPIDPGLETPWAQQVAAGFDQALGQDFAFAANFIWVRGKDQVGTIDYNPVVPSLGAGRRPNDVNGVAGTSASVLQYTSFGETWYRGLTLSLSKRLSHNYQFLLSYTLSKAEDNSTDFQSAFIPQQNGLGRNPSDRTGLPVGFDPGLEKGPATHDQRHRFVLSGLYQLPAQFQISTIITAASGRPFTPLAGADLNGDGDGGAFPSDRARRDPASEASSVGRNSETMDKQIIVDLRLSKRIRMGSRAYLDLIAEAFNLFNRTNYSEINNIFGRGAFPASPQTDAQGRVTYGLYEQALAPRQIQLAAKIGF
jgi:hypothetical protein